MDPLDVPLEIASGSHCCVQMTVRVKREYDTWALQARAGLRQVMKILAEEGHDDLNKKQFVAEERFKPKGRHTKEMVYAVKDFKVRLYGCFVGSGPRRFVCTYFDASKKQDRADRGALQRAADYIAPHLGG